MAQVETSLAFGSTNHAARAYRAAQMAAKTKGHNVSGAIAPARRVKAFASKGHKAKRIATVGSRVTIVLARRADENSFRAKVLNLDGFPPRIASPLCARTEVKAISRLAKRFAIAEGRPERAPISTIIPSFLRPTALEGS